MREFRTNDRALPLVVTLVVLSIVIMTFDIRSEGEGVLATLRGATNTLLEPVERLGSVVVSPLADVIENLSEIRSLRDENEALRAKLAEEHELVHAANQRAQTILERSSREAQILKDEADEYARSVLVDLSEQVDTLDGQIAQVLATIRNGLRTLAERGEVEIE